MIRDSLVIDQYLDPHQNQSQSLSYLIFRAIVAEAVKSGPSMTRSPPTLVTLICDAWSMVMVRVPLWTLVLYWNCSSGSKGPWASSLLLPKMLLTIILD